MAEEVRENIIEKNSLGEEEIQHLVERYDVESRFRRPSGFAGKFVVCWCAAMSCFHLYTAGIGLLPTSIQRAVHLLFAMVAVFLLYPSSQRADKTQIPWYDWILALLAAIGTGYIVFFFNDIAHRGAKPFPADIVLGCLTLALVVEAGRRILGNVLPALAVFFLLYCFFGRYAPAMFMHRGYSLARVIQHMYLTSEGIFGVALGVSATFVFMFVLFGAFLAKSGGARLFNELALALAGHSPGGPAKVAVVASGLLGTINGSSVANVATTGAFTIPLMKRVGYPPEYAGAVEACASTGGQLMPPIMGAGAFIMSELLGVPYLSIAAAAALPAALYYGAIFINVHLRARALGLVGLDRASLPRPQDVLRRDGHLLIPLGAIIAMLLMKFTPLASAFWGIVTVVLVGALRSSSRLGWREIVAALDEGARGSLGVAMACALVGFVVGTSSLTSLGLNLSNNIIYLSGGNLFFMLVLSMIACLVLGMGLPTTANYIVCSTIIAPALVKLGALPLAAHLFVFYFGIMADLTPPVCLAAFTGAGIAGADPTRTGIQATTMALVAYLLPYTFVYTPAILLQGATLVSLGILVGASVLGMLGLASAGQGWMFRTLGGVERLGALALGVGAFWPHPVVKVGSSLGLAGFLFLERLAARRAAERSVQGA